MEPLRHLDRDIRRARLLAARTRPVGGINRRGIFTGHWDRGDVVRQFRGGNGSWLGLATYLQVDENISTEDERPIRNRPPHPFEGT
jgi:hypothetical protein